MGAYEEAVEFLEENKSLDGTIEEKFTKFKTRYKTESGLDYTDENVGKLWRFATWLKGKGAIFSKVRMKYYGPDFRGVHTFKQIKKSEVILSIPKELIITPQLGRETPIGKQVMNSGVKIAWDHLFYITLFLLEQFHDANSPWKPYIDVYPKLVSSFPLFYPEKEKSLLQGSTMMEQIEDEIEEMESEYERIAEVVPELRKFSVDEYMRNKMLVTSRIFLVKMHGVAERIMVPFADMFNHHYDKIGQTHWKYEDSNDSFVVTAKHDIPSGDAVFFICIVDMRKLRG